MFAEPIIEPNCQLTRQHVHEWAGHPLSHGILVIDKAWKDPKDRGRVNDRINMARIVSQSVVDLVEDEKDPNGNSDGLGLQRLSTEFKGA